MRWAVAAAAALAFGGAAAAQEGGRIRTGEHDGFSRVVLVVEPTTEWSLELGPREATIVFPGRNLAFTTEEVWVRMPRTRVIGIEPGRTPEGSAVRIALGCDCRVTASFVGARYLALDVHDRGAARFSAGPAAVAPAPEAMPAGAGTADALAAAERILIGQIERAADQGLIQLADRPAAEDPRLPAAEDLPPPRPMTEAPDPGAPAPAPRPLAPPALTDAGDDARLLAHLAIRPPAHEQIAAMTVFDRDSRAAAARLAGPPPPEACRSDEALDVARWSDGRPLADQAVELRRLLVGEFDRANPATVRDLVRLHIRHGLGAEAGEILRGFDAAIDERALLADLARVVEGRAPAPDGPLGQDIACPGRHGLWLAVAGRPAALAAEAHFRSLRGAFEDMPPDLRLLIGPDLVGRFLDAGRPAEARILHDVVARPGVPLDAAMRLVSGRLAAAEDRALEAEATLAELVDANAPNAPDAILALVRTRLDRGERVPGAWLTDLRTLALEHRHGRREPLARVLVAEALARDGDLRGAFAALAALAGEVPEARATVEELAPRLLAAADPAEVGAAAYAETVLEHAGLITPARANDAARVVIGRQLLDLGLANAARAILMPAAERGRASARLLAARAELALGAPDAALARLEGLAGRDAAALRARALAHAGDFAAASAVMSEAGAAEDALPYAWASGDWELAADSPHPALAAMAGYMQARGGPAGDELPVPLTPEAAFRQLPPSLDRPSLRAARTLLEAGREVGGFVAGLLAPSER